MGGMRFWKAIMSYTSLWGAFQIHPATAHGSPLVRQRLGLSEVAADTGFLLRL